MPGVAEGLLLHVGRADGPDQRPQAVGVEGFQRAEAGEIDELGVGEGRPDDQGPVLDVAGWTDVLLDHVDGGEDGFVVVRPFPDLRQPPDVDQHGADLVQALLGISGQDVGHAGSDPAIHEGGDALGFGQGIEGEGVLRKEGDVDDALAGFQHGPEGPESHESGDRAEDKVEAGDEAADILRPGQVGPQRPHAADFRQPGQGFRVDIDRRDFEKRIGSQVRGHGAADQAGAENDDFHIDLAKGNEKDSGKVRGSRGGPRIIVR